MKRTVFKLDEKMQEKIQEKITIRRKYLPRFVFEYIESIEDTHSLQTQYEYMKDIHLFLDYLAKEKKEQPFDLYEFNIEDMRNVTEKDVDNFFRYIINYEKEFFSVGGNLITQKFSNHIRGLERKRSSLYNFFKYLFTYYNLTINPFESFQFSVKKFQQKDKIEMYELNRMLDTAYNFNPEPFRALRNKVILQLLAYLGIKISELILLNIPDVWEKRHEIAITRKNGEKDILPIPEEIRKDLYRYIQKRKEIEYVKKGHYEALFLSQQKRRLDPRSVRKMIKIVANKAEINKNITPNTFRYTFASKLWNETKNLELTTALIGNKTLHTVIYTNRE